MGLGFQHQFGAIVFYDFDGVEERRHIICRKLYVNY
jgi:hypothetical protein